MTISPYPQSRDGRYMSHTTSILARVLFLTVFLLPPLAAVPQGTCVNEHSGICWDEPTSISGPEPEASFIFVWREQPAGSGCYVLSRLVRWFRRLSYPLVNGQGEIEVLQLVYVEWRPVGGGLITYKPADGVVGPYPDGIDGAEIPNNPAPTPGATPPPYPPGAPGGGNCHGRWLPPPAWSPPPPSPGVPGGVRSSDGDTPPPGGGVKVNGDEAEKAISGGSCYSEIECNPPRRRPQLWHEYHDLPCPILGGNRRV